MHTSTRLGLDIPDSTDAVSGFPTVAAQQMGILDKAAIYTEGTLVSRPAASSVAKGTQYRTTDTNAETFTWSDGTQWLPLGLIPTGVNTNSTVLNGQHAITFGFSALTITLPTNVAGTLVAVTNGLAGAVTTVSGGTIQGGGVGGSSSFKLGTQGNGVVLMGDGTNWNIIAGQQDTGWVALTPGTNVSASSSPAAAARLVGDRVYHRGYLQATATLTNPATLATLPAGAFATAITPNNVAQFIVPAELSSTYSTAYLNIFPTSGLTYTLVQSGLASGTALNLSTLSYSL